MLCIVVVLPFLVLTLIDGYVVEHYKLHSEYKEYKEYKEYYTIITVMQFTIPMLEAVSIYTALVKGFSETLSLEEVF